MAKQNYRVDVPISPNDLIALAKRILAKDTALADDSPVKNIKDWAQFQNVTTTADTNNNQSNDLYRKAEEATQNRDNALGHTGQLKPSTVRYFVTAARDVLLGINKGNEQALGEWGFDVSYSGTGNGKPQPVPQPAPQAVAESKK
jgi:hypothetical protein